MLANKIYQKGEKYMKKDKIKGLVASVVIITMSFGLCGCGNKSTDNRIVVEMVQYKPEAADYLNNWKRSLMQHMMIFN